MPRLTVRGPIEKMNDGQWNVLVRNVEEIVQFWKDNEITTKLDWAGMNPPKSTVGRKELVARCAKAGEGAEVEYIMETEDRAGGFRGVKGVDLREISPLQA